MNDQNRHVLIMWAIEMLPKLKPGGKLFVPDNSPLSSEEVADALREIAKNPAYKSQTISVPDRDGFRTVLYRSGGINFIEKNETADEPHPRVMPDGASVFIREEEDGDHAG